MNYDEYIRDLKLFTLMEYSAAATLILSVSIFVQPVILLLPLVLLIHLLIDTQKAPVGIVSHIRSIAPFTNKIKFRMREQNDFSVFRIPFLNFVFISQMFTNHEDIDEGAILHEFGHTKQYDIVASSC